MKKVTEQAIAFAPATIGNVGVGFDVLGLAVDSIGDQVTVKKTETGDIRIKKITGIDNLPLDPLKNTATVGLIQLCKDLNLPFGFEVEIKKGIPLGSGMGGSASSAVAAIVAANSLLSKSLTKSDMMKYALMGEAIATGSIHGDNVAPCLFGGLTLVQSLDPLHVISIPIPKDLFFVLVHPGFRLDTKAAREILKPHIDLKDYVKQTANLAGFIAGCFIKDFEVLKNSLSDILIEPQRAHLIEGFQKIKGSALDNGALGCSISGAGPTVFAVTKGKSTANKVKNAMVVAFKNAKAPKITSWITQSSSKGAHII